MNIVFFRTEVLVSTFEGHSCVCALLISMGLDASIVECSVKKLPALLTLVVQTDSALIEHQPVINVAAIQVIMFV